jgi:aryl-alcohol dehydrogenase-like predicted oxidoreductase
MRHLHALVTAKQVLYLGVSDTPAWVVVKANECEFQQDFLRYFPDAM